MVNGFIIIFRIASNTAEKTPKQLEPAENLVTDNNKSEKRVDVDELLETLKRDENAEK